MVFVTDVETNCQDALSPNWSCCVILLKVANDIVFEQDLQHLMMFKCWKMYYSYIFIQMSFTSGFPEASQHDLSVLHKSEVIVNKEYLPDLSLFLCVLSM